VATRASRTSSSAAASEAARLPALPGFDLAGASARLGDNTALLADLLRTFAAEHAESGERIGALLRSERPATAVAELHRLKSAARIVGAQTLAAAAEALEVDIRHGRPADMRAFRDALFAAITVIGRHVIAPGATPRPGGRDAKPS
jgi:HPt (histidine-containing phosphotransfer) domain-containing protein